MEGIQNEQLSVVDESSELERVIELVMTAMEKDVRQGVESLFSKRDEELLGPGEFDLRARMLKAIRCALETVINERSKKGATEAAARLAQTVATTQSSSTGERKKSSACSARSR